MDVSQMPASGHGADRPGRMVGRREGPAGAGALGATTAEGALSTPITASADASTGLGSFLVTVTSSTAGQPAGTAVVSLAGGGVAAAVSSMPRGAHLGSWTADSGGALQLRVIAFQFDSGGNNTGYLQVDAGGDVHGDSISASYRVTFVPVSGPSAVVDSGTLAGRRLAA